MECQKLKNTKRKLIIWVQQENEDNRGISELLRQNILMYKTDEEPGPWQPGPRDTVGGE